jgi:myo-inositol-1(or 4)-monophosphatase
VSRPDTLEDARARLGAAVDEAGALALRHFRNPGEHWYKGPGQVVTEADLQVDALLRERLLGAPPDAGWLSEESRDDGSRFAAQRVWIVDPIDGTRAFADGIPEFTISIALVDQGVPVLGVVLNPATGERFEAGRGAGATLNGRSLRVSGRTALAGARLLSSRGEIGKRRWRELIPEAEVRTMGSLAYKLALIATGRFDGLLSLRRTHDWDIAAALLILEEAGAVLSDAAGRPLRLNRDPPRHDGLVAASSPALHGLLLARLRAPIPA